MEKTTNTISKPGAEVTVTFALASHVDPQKFIEWLHTEVDMGNDFAATNDFSKDEAAQITGPSVELIQPVTVQYFTNPGQYERRTDR